MYESVDGIEMELRSDVGGSAESVPRRQKSRDGNASTTFSPSLIPHRSAQLLKLSILTRSSLCSTIVCVCTPEDISRQKGISVVFAGFFHPALTSRTQPQSWVMLQLPSLYSHRTVLT